MSTKVMARRQWGSVRAMFENYPAGTILRYPRASLPHPREAGAHVSAGWPVGQQADYRFDSEVDCRGMHVHEFAEHYDVHVDRVHPSCGVIEHLQADAPHALYTGAALVGGALGAALGKKRESVMLGAGLGLVCAALLQGASASVGEK